MLALRDEEPDEELRQHLVEADRANLELEEHNNALLAEIETLGKDKAYLECEINQLKAKPATLEAKSTAVSTVPTDPNQDDIILRLTE